MSNKKDAIIEEMLAKEKDSGLVREINYHYFEDSYRRFLGKILTIVDASIIDEIQNKCIKDLIKQEFNRRMEEIMVLYEKGETKPLN